MSGSMNMNCKVSVCFMLMLYSNLPLFAEEQTVDEAIPSMEFLEFLGEWETEQGEWIDPVTLEGDEVGKLIETVDEDLKETNDKN